MGGPPTEGVGRTLPKPETGAVRLLLECFLVILKDFSRTKKKRKWKSGSKSPLMSFMLPFIFISTWNCCPFRYRTRDLLFVELPVVPNSAWWLMSGGISFHLAVPNMDSLVCYLNLNNSNILVSDPIFPAKDRGIGLPNWQPFGNS